MQILENVKLNLVKIILLIPLLLVSYSNAVSVSANYHKWTFSVEVENGKIRTKYGINPPWSDWVDINGTGSTYSGNSHSYYKIWVEVNHEKIKLKGNCTSSGWANFYSNFSLSAKDGCHIPYIVRFERNNNRIRVCVENNCSSWVNVASCPSGYTYNASRNICEANPICSQGTYDPQAKKCYIGDWTCPLGDNYECVKLSDNKNYCSNLYCGDVSSQNSYEDTDTPEGANDKQPDGQVDESGNCLGTIYIFNGQDKRCRKSGTQTAFNNCCEKDTIKLLGLVNIGKCNSNEVYLSRLRNWGQRDGKCHYVGEYCSEYWEVARKKFCVQKKKTFCCFSSPLARIIQEQGRQQLGISWGEPDNPNCRGFTPDEFQKIDFSKIDFSEWINNEVIPNIQNNLKNNLQNTMDQIKNNIQNKYN